MTLEDWYQQLEATPGDSTLRLVLADWLEDHGEEAWMPCEASALAHAHRWMVEQDRWPGLCTMDYGSFKGCQVCFWGDSDAERRGYRRQCLPDRLYHALKGHFDKSIGWIYYLSRLEAERALATALEVQLS